MIDCYTREVASYYFGYHCTGDNVKETMISALITVAEEYFSNTYEKQQRNTVHMQYSENFLSIMNIPYKSIHPATPNEDVHIEFVQFNFGRRSYKKILI